MMAARSGIGTSPDATENYGASKGGSPAAPPALTSQISDAVATAAQQSLRMDDSPEDFVIWLRSFTP